MSINYQDDPKFPTMWEISTRPWMYELSKKYSRNITNILMIPMSEFESLKAQGVDIVWMMGVWNLGVFTKKRYYFSIDYLPSNRQIWTRI